MKTHDKKEAPKMRRRLSKSRHFSQNDKKKPAKVALSVTECGSPWPTLTIVLAIVALCILVALVALSASGKPIPTEVSQALDKNVSMTITGLLGILGIEINKWRKK